MRDISKQPLARVLNGGSTVPFGGSVPWSVWPMTMQT